MDLKKNIIVATKWSSITELAAKLVTPISTIVLARLLTPDAFGILVTATMVISFAELFTDAGFHKYLIQHEFKSEDDERKSTTVAFWSNLLLSLLMWVVICVFAYPIARLVGCSGYEMVIPVSCFCIPLSAFSSIQSALFKRHFDFKTLFYVRLVGILLPILVTIPLAALTHSFWSLIVGMLALNLSNAIILTVKSSWKPSFYFDWVRFKEMLSFSIWSMFESVTIWLTSYIDAFIVGSYLSQYYLGVYRTSITVVGQIIGIVTAATTPVLYSSLSRLQNDDNQFLNIFFKFQKIVGIFVIPLGAGIFLFRDLIVAMLLGNQWVEAAYFIGIWGLTSSITIVLSHYSSEVYRAKGKPKFSVVAQILHIIVLCPVVLLFVNKGFESLCTARAIVRLELIIVNLIIMYVFFNISSLKMFLNISPAIVASLTMSAIYYFLPEPSNIFLKIAYVPICIVVYFFVIIFFRNERDLIKTIRKKLR